MWLLVGVLVGCSSGRSQASQEPGRRSAILQKQILLLDERREKAQAMRPPENTDKLDKELAALYHEWQKADKQEAEWRQMMRCVALRGTKLVDLTVQDLELAKTCGIAIRVPIVPVK